MNRLKLYDDVLILSISKKDKNKFKSLAYKNNLTMSEFNRKIIKLVIKYCELNKNKDNNFKSSVEINNILNSFGRNIK